MKIAYAVVPDTLEVQKLIKKKIVSAVRCGSSDLIVARYAVNKSNLIKISKEELAKA